MDTKNNNQQPQHSVRKISLRTTLFFDIFGLMMLTVLCTTIATFFIALHELTVRTNAQLQTISQNKAIQFENTIVSQRENLALVRNNMTPSLIDSFSDLEGFEALLSINNSGTTVLAGSEAIDVPFAFLESFAMSDATVFRPLLTDNGWDRYIITSPQYTDGIRTGTLVAIFNTKTLINRVLIVDEAGKTAEVLLQTATDNEEMLLHLDPTTKRAVPIRTNQGDNFAIATEINNANDSVIQTTDYAGIAVVAAYRNIPTLGWSVITKIDRYEAMSPIIRLALRIAGIGGMVVVLLSLSTFVITRRISSPLEELVQKLDGLESKRWMFEKTIRTGNEIEVLDNAAADLTQRLRSSHEHLEDIVQVRTEELRHMHAQDQAVLQSMDDGIVVTDKNGIVTYMNGLARMLTGSDKAEGRSITDVIMIHSKEGNLLSPAEHPASLVLKDKVRYAPSADPQFSLQHADGTKTALQIRATPIMSDKNCEGVIAIIRDISEERRIDLMKSEFIALVSHQLRTPLSTMSWYIEMLSTNDTDKLTADQKEYIAEVAASNNRMTVLVNALLNVARIELEKFHVEPEAVNLRELITSVMKYSELESTKKKLQLNLVCDAENTTIESDKGLVCLIAENLISNAIKYSLEGKEVTIKIAIDEPNKTAILSVEDRGIGIPTGEQKEIGHRLFRATNATKTDTDGNGLGLYISHVAAQSIGGTLTFVSTNGEGTIFTLTMPLQPKKLII